MPAGALSFRYFILGLLDQQPMSGYDIKRRLKSLGWLVDGPSFGNIYSTLHALLEEQLVTVEVVSQQNKPSRKVYNITDAGRQVLGNWASHPTVSNLSLKTFLMGLILAGSFSKDRLVAQLQKRHAQVAAQRDALAQTADALEEGADVQHLALNYGLALATAELAWLDSTLSRLSNQQLPVEAVLGN